MKKPIIPLLCITLLVTGIVVFAMHTQQQQPPPAVTPVEPEPIQTSTDVVPPSVVPEPVVIQNDQYYSLTLSTTTPLAELKKVVGTSNVEMVLKLNRIDGKFLKTGSVLTIPKDMTDWMALSPFPSQLPDVDVASVPKLMMVSQRVQAFGVYEYGTLVRWGPVSTGKSSTPTPSRLYFTNWKGREVKSTFDDEWILKWNFNLDNKEGIGMHQYEMPGYPASHSCIRMFEADAQWLYNWADQWVLSDNEQVVVAHGTPVLVFGNYSFGKTAPWKKLPAYATATTLSLKEIETSLTPALPTIIEYQSERTTPQDID